MSNTILQSIPVGQKVGIAFSGGLDTSASRSSRPLISVKAVDLVGTVMSTGKLASMHDGSSA
jgi:argininosuccinate synthase